MLYGRIFTKINFEKKYFFKKKEIKLKKFTFFNSETSQVVLTATLVFSVILGMSIWYVAEDPKMTMYLAIKKMFFFGMFGILISDALEILLLSWEVIGWGSSTLIGFWNSRISTLKSGLKSLSINKSGDLGILNIWVQWFSQCKNSPLKV